MRVLVIDNYDSFTYNLVYLLKESTPVTVVRNDKFRIEDINNFDKILLSPGPGIPEEAGLMQEVIKKYAPTKSILGVCLGHQGIAEAFGGKLQNMGNVLHGVTTPIEILEPSELLFQNIPTSFKACRYHSWVVLEDNLNENFTITARDSKGQIMAISHKKYDVKGVQFHPEAYLTEYGKILINNWLRN